MDRRPITTRDVVESIAAVVVIVAVLTAIVLGLHLAGIAGTGVVAGVLGAAAAAVGLRWSARRGRELDKH